MIVDRAKIPKVLQILKGLQILCTRKALRFIPLLLVIVGGILLSIRMKYSMIETFVHTHYLVEQDELSRSESIRYLKEMNMTLIHETPVSPLDLIYEYDEDINKKRQRTWNPLKSNSEHKHFVELDRTSQCHFYFENLYVLNPNWTNDFKRWAFLPQNIDELGTSRSLDENGVLSNNSYSILLDNRLNSASLVMERIRIYRQCFSGPLFPSDRVLSANEMVARNHETPEFEKFAVSMQQLNIPDQWDFEHRMWPIIKYYNNANFTNLMPIIIGSAGALKQGHLPLDGSKHPKGELSAEYKYDDDRSFLWNWNNMSSKFASRGIVLSFEESEVPLAAKLIATLRYLKNELPIQIITKGDLSEKSIRELYEIAEGNDIFDPSVNVKNRNAPKQVIWFVDVSPTLDPSYSHEFKGTKRPFLAALLSLCIECVFIDVHVIPYVLVDKLNRDRWGSLSGGALFFQGSAIADSSILDSSDLEDCRYMMSDLFPSWAEEYYGGDNVWLDDYAMENTCAAFRSSEKKAYKNLLYHNSRDNIDNGIFIIDKYRHISSLMIGTFLSLGKVCEKCGIEDKEFLWLGFALSTTDYRFPKHIKPAVIGESVDISQDISDSDRMLNHKIVKICGESLSHVTTAGQLIWTNLRVNYCGLEGVHSDGGNKTLKSETFTTAGGLKKLHKTPLNPKECIFAAAGNGALRTVGESCNGPLICATYEQHVRPYTFDEIIERGSMVHIKSDSIAEYDRINEVWDNNYLT